jgi:hypothetical protein
MSLHKGRPLWEKLKLIFKEGTLGQTLQEAGRERYFDSGLAAGKMCHPFKGKLMRKIVFIEPNPLTSSFHGVSYPQNWH